MKNPLNGGDFSPLHNRRQALKEIRVKFDIKNYPQENLPAAMNLLLYGVKVILIYQTPKIIRAANSSKIISQSHIPNKTNDKRRIELQAGHLYASDQSIEELIFMDSANSELIEIDIMQVQQIEDGEPAKLKFPKSLKDKLVKMILQDPSLQNPQ